MTRRVIGFIPLSRSTITFRAKIIWMHVQCRPAYPTSNLTSFYVNVSTTAYTWSITIRQSYDIVNGTFLMARDTWQYKFLPIKSPFNFHLTILYRLMASITDTFMDVFYCYKDLFLVEYKLKRWYWVKILRIRIYLRINF